MLIVCNQSGELKYYIVVVFDSGVMLVEVLEIIIYFVFYVGWFNVMLVVSVVKIIFEVRGVMVEVLFVVLLMLLLFNEQVEKQCVDIVEKNVGFILSGLVKFIVDLLFFDFW